MTRQNDISENLNHWDYIDRYSTWMYHVYQNYVGKRIFDVGAGIGRMVSYYIDRAEKVVATDIFQEQVDYMNQKFSQYSYFCAQNVDILESDLSAHERQFDTVICINVLEHLSDDYLAVKKMNSLVATGGHIIILVPAWQKLYCDLDKNVSHYRRYDPGRLEDIAHSCDLQIVKHHYFNRLGVIPYWIKGHKKVKKDESFSSSLNESNSKIYNFASRVLEPIEKKFPPKKGLTEVIILKKTNAD